MQKGREIVSGVQDPAARGPGGKEYQAALCFARSNLGSKLSPCKWE